MFDVLTYYNFSISSDQFTQPRQNQRIEEVDTNRREFNPAMSKVATNFVSTIIERDKVIIKNGGTNHENQDRMPAIEEDVEPTETNNTANYWVNQLTLLPHPFMEETYFKETFIDPQIVQVKKNEEEENANQGADEMTRYAEYTNTLK